MDEKGYIKFSCQLIDSKPPEDAAIEELNAWRNKMFTNHLIGQYPNGIGFGNVSCRNDSEGFIISGTATGGITELSNKHYVRVTKYNFQENSLVCKGKINASSESLTHAAIYETLAEVKGVIHIHNAMLWNKYKNILPTTSSSVEYGTPEMASEIKRLLLVTSEKHEIIIMGGHREGIIAFAPDLEKAGKAILNLLNRR